MTRAFRYLSKGTVFRALRPEKIGERVIANDGIYVKIGNSHSVEISTEEALNHELHDEDRADVILPLHMPCRILKNDINLSRLFNSRSETAE